MYVSLLHGYDVFTSRVHIVCTAYGWVCSCSTHTTHNTLTALTPVHLWCMTIEVTFLVCMSCVGKVHAPMSVWSPYDLDVPHNTCTHSMCRVCTHRCLCCGQYVFIGQLHATGQRSWHNAPWLTQVRGVCTPHCSVHATCFNHEDQVPMGHC